jgi:ectoine hydroxylase-related dioxygenase (phytanoyl-CoA dioxygenase family)
MNEPTPACDLSFQPVVNPQPRHLTPAQIAFYNEHGYLMPFDIFTPAEAVANRAYFDSLLQQIRAANDGRDAYAINGYHTRCRGLYELATAPRILDHVADLVGPNIIVWGTHFFCKLPGDPKSVHWHQDASYWPLSPARTVTVWLAIDDADTGNSCMHFIPGTHNRGQLAYQEPTEPSVLWQEVVNAEQYGQPVADILRAGQMSLHADMLVHGSGPNRSDRRRCGLTIRYCPPSVRPLKANWGQNAILCRGRDTAGHWQYRPPPTGEDLSPANKPAVIGGN